MLKGKDGVVKTGSPATEIGRVQNWNIDETADVVAGWGMGDDSETAFATVSRYSGSLEAYLDPANSSEDISVGDTLALELYPGGEATGSGYYSGTVLVTSAARSGSKDGIPTISFNFRNQSGKLTKGTVT